MSSSQCSVQTAFNWASQDTTSNAIEERVQHEGIQNAATPPIRVPDPKPVEPFQEQFRAIDEAQGIKKDWSVDYSHSDDEEEVVEKKKGVKKSEDEDEEYDREHLGRRMECDKCQQEMPEVLAVQCPEHPTHLFCIDCLTQHAEQQIQRRRGYLHCLSKDEKTGLQCTAQFTARFVDDCLEDDVVKRLVRLEWANHYEEAEDTGSTWGMDKCPFCGWMAISPEVWGETDDPYFECRRPGCGREICRECLEERHGDLSCVRVRAIDRWVEEAMVADLDWIQEQAEQLEEAWEGAEEDPFSQSVCDCPHPGCEAPVARDWTRNVTTCPICKTVFCWRCRESIKEVQFSHFDSGACKGQMFTGLDGPPDTQSEDGEEEGCRNDIDLGVISAAHNYF